MFLLRTLILVSFSGLVVGYGEQPGSQIEKNESSDTKLSESAFKEQMGVGGATDVVYADEKGNPISLKEFMEAISSGRSFSKDVEQDKSRASFKLNDIAATTSVRRPQHKLSVALAGEVPQLNLPDLEGNQHSLNGGDRYTLLSFFFAECIPCIQEIPELNQLGKSRTDMSVIAITFDANLEATDFIKKHGLTVPVVANAQEYIDALGVKVYPTLALISPDGRLVGTHVARSASGNGGEIQRWLQDLGL